MQMRLPTQHVLIIYPTKVAIQFGLYVTSYEMNVK